MALICIKWLRITQYYPLYKYPNGYEVAAQVKSSEP